MSDQQTKPKPRPTGAFSKYKLIWSIVLIALTLVLSLAAWYFADWRFKPIIWLAVASVVTAVAFVYDKWRANRNAGETGKGRVPEIALLTSCLIGGTVGGWVLMFALHHKTGDRRFLIKLVVITIIQALVLGFMFARFFDGEPTPSG